MKTSTARPTICVMVKLVGVKDHDEVSRMTPKMCQSPRRPERMKPIRPMFMVMTKVSSSSAYWLRTDILPHCSAPSSLAPLEQEHDR